MRRFNLPDRDVTPESAYLTRRSFLVAAGVLGAGLAGAEVLRATGRPSGAEQQGQGVLGTPYGIQPTDVPTPWEDVTGYNNFYEFGMGKDDPKRNAQGFKTRPWTVTVDGLCDKPGAYQLEDFLKPSKIEDRIYRFRCVEAWSMVIPWRGIMLKDVIDRARPRPSAKFVELTTLLDPRQMPGQRLPVLDLVETEVQITEGVHDRRRFFVAAAAVDGQRSVGAAGDQALDHLLAIHAEFGGQFGGRRRPTELLGQRGGGRADPQVQVLEPARHLHRPAVVPEVPADLAHDGGHREGHEVRTGVDVVADDGVDQPHPGHLQQILAGLPAAGEPAGDVVGQR